MENLNILQDKWIKDINDDHFINLKGCIVIERFHYVFSDGSGERNSITFNYDGKTSQTIYFENETLMNNFYEHLRIMLDVEEIDSTKGPLKIE